MGPCHASSDPWSIPSPQSRKVCASEMREGLGFCDWGVWLLGLFKVLGVFDLHKGSLDPSIKLSGMYTILRDIFGFLWTRRV